MAKCLPKFSNDVPSWLFITIIAAPEAVVSNSDKTIISLPVTSALICEIRLTRASPPDNLIVVTSAFVSPIASIIVLSIKAAASNTALVISFLVCIRSNPKNVPLALSFQIGARSPRRYGKKTMPRAPISDSAASFSITSYGYSSFE